MSAVSFDRIKDALRDKGSSVRETGPGRATAQCPAHDDRNPSLSITLTEGRTLLYCHGGCPTENVLGAINFTMADLYDHPQHLNRYGDVYARYEYPGGRVVYRTADKQFPQPNRAKNKTDRSLFHADRIGDAATVYVVEGEEDVYAIETDGGVATCPAMGAGKADKFDWSELRGKTAIVVADKDEPGREHARQVAEQLAGIATEIRIVEAVVGKDASDHIAAGKALDELALVDWWQPNADNETVQTVPWPTLSRAALHGTAGEIVNLVAPHTEADPAAMLVQLHAVFGATLGSGPHFVAGNERHPAIIHPLIVGRTNNGAKGTSLGVVEAIRKCALPEFDACTASGLSSAEGLIELVRDPSGDDPDDKNFDPGALDKRLLVKESEYKSVLVRQRRDGNTLSQTLRDAFDGKTLRTLTRKNNSLTATGPHIVVIGHVTPREFRNTLQDSDLAGGSVNRLVICLSRRTRLHSRLGNLPDDVLAAAAAKFKAAHDMARKRWKLEFANEFWRVWDTAYRELNRDRPDSAAADATARGVTMVLRLSMLYALFDGNDMIDAQHLDAALALWSYAEHSARWLFSNHELEQQRENAGSLANFIFNGGSVGRTRTEISREYFKGNANAAQINTQLEPLVHEGVVIEVKDQIGARPITRYIHRGVRTNELTNNAGQGACPVTNSTNSARTQPGVQPREPDVDSSEFVESSSCETPPDLHSSSNSLIRKPIETDTNSAPPGGLTAQSPGQTPRVQQALARAHANENKAASPEAHARYRAKQCIESGCGLPPSPARTRCEEHHRIWANVTAGYDR